MKKITTMLTFSFAGFSVWIVYLVWMTFFSNYINLNPTYNTRYWEEVVAFDNLENSTEQRKFKKEFEKLLIIYLEQKNLYSNEELLVEMKKSTIGIINYSDFYRILNIYIGYLQKNHTQNNKEKLYKIVDRNLEHFSNLMRHSNDFPEYLFASGYMERFLKSLDCSNDFVTLFEKHPFVGDELFFKKVEINKQKYVSTLIDLLSPEQKKNVKNIQTMKIISRYVEKIVNEIYRREVIVFKDGSSEARENHKKYLNKLELVGTDFSVEWNELWTLTINKKLKKENEIYIYLYSSLYLSEGNFDFLVHGYEIHKHVNRLYRMFLNGCIDKEQVLENGAKLGF